VRRLFGLALTGSLLAAAGLAGQQAANYDESKVPAYTLPDPLRTASGQRVTTAAAWTSTRRPQILELFRRNVYGRSPAGRPRGMTFETVSVDRQALDGTAVRKQVTISFTGDRAGQKLDLLVYLPARAPRPVAVFLGLSFGGNAAVNPDPGIALGEVWRQEKTAPSGYTKAAATDKARGSEASRWQVPMILEAGFGLATAYYQQIEPDFDNAFTLGVHTLFAKPGEPRDGDAWGAIGAWAWGLSRAMDYLETDKDVDAKRVAVIGHSRLGKTALWAGAEDERFALVVSNCSGEGGAAISRRMFGENVKDLNTRFPHWFCPNYRQYDDHVPDLPVDQHMLLALIAPRPLYVASAAEDQWADPKGEFLSAVAATPVYHLFGKKGIETDQMPDLHKPVGDTVRYHVRAGKHDVTAYDWEQYLAFAKEQFGKR
jgi:hypothetical protein